MKDHYKRCVTGHIKYTKIFLKYGKKIKSSKQLANIIDDTFFCM